MARFALTHPREKDVSDFNHDLSKSYILNDFEIKKNEFEWRIRCGCS